MSFRLAHATLTFQFMQGMRADVPAKAIPIPCPASFDTSLSSYHDIDATTHVVEQSLYDADFSAL
jgi:hypothetical protein